MEHMVTEEAIDILNEPVERMTEERLRLVVGLLRKRVAYYEEQNAKLAAANDSLREESERPGR